MDRFKLQEKGWKEMRRGKRVYKVIGRDRRKRLAWLEIERQKWMNEDELYEPKIQWIRKFKKTIPLDEIERKKRLTKQSHTTISSNPEEHLDVLKKRGEMVQTLSFKPEKVPLAVQKDMKKELVFKWLQESKRKREEAKREEARREIDKVDTILKKKKSSDTMLKQSDEIDKRKILKKAKPENKFVCKVLKTMGAYICEMRQKADETPFSRYLRLLSSPKSTLVEDEKEFHTGSKFKGQFSPLGMDGSGTYQLAHGPIYEGFVVDGKFEGFGRMMYPNGGILEGTWSNGVICNPHYVFKDGHHYGINEWRYCQMPDRRFQSEILNGMRAPLNVQLANDHPAREIPLNCLDAGEGFYDPRKHFIFHATKGDVIRIPSKKEGEWIKENCRKAWDENVPFKREMYENWFQGSKLYLEEDEAGNREVLNQLFPNAKIFDTDLDEVVLTRAAALRQSLLYASKTHEMDYPTKLTEALPFYNDGRRHSS